jgi:hypothetical protein
MRRLVFVVLSLCVASAVTAQQPPKLTWVRYIQVNAGHEADFFRMTMESNRVLDRLIAEKRVAAWGLAVPLTRNEEPWTHAVYITIPNWTALEETVAAVEAAHMGRAPEDAKRLDAIAAGAIRSGSIRDVILRHVVQSEAPMTLKPKYLVIATHHIKPGREADAAALFTEWAKPVFLDAAAKGKLGAWGVSVQDGSTLTGGWTYMVWSFLSHLTALDEVDDAMTALGTTKVRGYDIRLRDMSEPEKRRSQILRVVHHAP